MTTDITREMYPAIAAAVTEAVLVYAKADEETRLQIFASHLDSARRFRSVFPDAFERPEIELQAIVAKGDIRGVGGQAAGAAIGTVVGAIVGSVGGVPGAVAGGAVGNIIGAVLGEYLSEKR